MSTKTSMPKAAQAINAAKRLIESRQPKSASGDATFRLKKNLMFNVKPKFVFTDKEGNKTLIRYSRNSNSIFAEEQDALEGEVTLERISLDKSNMIKDQNLRDFLLLHPQYGKIWTLVDKVKDAEEAMAQVEQFDNVWDEIRKLKEEELKALNILVLDARPGSVSGQTIPELRISLRPTAERSPKKVEEAMQDPILKPLYMYYMAEALKILKYDVKEGIVRWVATNKELCRVPVNKDPAKHTARLLLEDEYLSAKETLEKELYD